ncbi:MAG: PulJ/GspJ family protein [Bradyrhizobium sp.]
MSLSDARGGRSKQHGFTLLEILIAFAILSISMVVLFRAFSNGLESSGRAETWVMAIATARSALDRVGADIPLRPGVLTGEDGEGQPWTLRIDLAPDAGKPLTVLPIALYRVIVSVPVAGDTAFTLTSLRLGPSPAGSGAP